MVDITLQELKDVMAGLGNSLSNTRGDRATLSKLEDMRKLLEQMQKAQSKFDLNAAAVQIGRTIAETIGRQTGVASGTLTTPNFNIINDGVIRARRDLTNELNLLATSFRGARAQIGAHGPGGVNPTNGIQQLGSEYKDFQGVLSQTKTSVSGFGRGLEATSAVATGLINTIGKVADSLNGQFEVYRRLSSLGQNFGGDMLAMTDISSRAKMSLDTFSKGLEQGSASLRQLGGRGFAEISVSLRDSMSSIGNMGMTVQQVNSALSDYVDQMKYQGGIDQVRNANFNQTFQNVISQTTSLSAAFGIAREQILKNAADLAKDPKWATMISNLGPEVQQRMTQLFASMKDSPAARKIMESALSVVQGVPDDNVGAYNALSPEAMQDLVTGIRKFRDGLIDTTQLMEIQQQAGKKIGEDVNSRGGMVAFTNAKGPVAETLRSGIVGGSELAATRINNAGAALTQPTGMTAEFARLDQRREMIQAGLDHLVMSTGRAFEQSITQFLRNENDAVEKYFNPLLNKMDKTAKSFGALDTAIGNLLRRLGPEGTVALHGGAELVAGAAGAYGTYLTGRSALSRWRGRGAAAATEAAAAAAAAGTAGAATAGAGGVAGAAGAASAEGAAGAAAGAPRALSSAERLAKGAKLLKMAGPIAAILEGLSTYSEIKAVAADYAEGKITKDQYKQKVGEAVGRGLGGFGGALVGAQLGGALGAAGGSLVAPGPGTAIGGIAGGIGGGIAGGFGGESIGGQVGGLMASFLPNAAQENAPSQPQPAAPSGQAPNGAAVTTQASANGSPGGPRSPTALPGPEVTDPVLRTSIILEALTVTMQRYVDEYHQEVVANQQNRQDQLEVFAAIEENTESLNRNARRNPAAVQ